MSLKVKPENKEAARGLVKPGKRLYLTGDRSRVVEADDPDRRFLFCTEHGRVSAAELERLGGATKAASGRRKKASTKAKPKAAAGGDAGEKGDAKGE